MNMAKVSHCFAGLMASSAKVTIYVLVAVLVPARSFICCSTASSPVTAVCEAVAVVMARARKKLQLSLEKNILLLDELEMSSV